MRDPKLFVRLAYHCASDGPRIMLFGPSTVDFVPVQDVFRRLSRNEGPFDFQTLPFVEAFGGIRMTASCSGSSDNVSLGKPQGLRRVSPKSDDFEWRRTAEGWDYLAELINTLVVRDRPGHQYLSSYPSEDAIIVLSKGEYQDDVLTRLGLGTR
jgi:hypothetical protein